MCGVALFFFSHSKPHPLQMSPTLEELFAQVDRAAAVDAHTEMRPRIGISMNRQDGKETLADPYFQSVILAGGAPVLVPATTELSVLTTIVDGLDGLLLTGGGDISPDLLGEAPHPSIEDVDPIRDASELQLIRLASQRSLPIFGICRGHQLLNVAFGGTLYQDLPSQFPKPVLLHSQKEARAVVTQTVTLTAPHSELRRALGLSDEALTMPIPVNSLHHQAVRDVAPGFVATAEAPDGVNEAMEHPEYPILSVQWHPEWLATTGHEPMLRLFRHFIGRAHRYAHARRLHHTMITLDSHTDTPMLFDTFDLGHKEGGRVNLPLMREGELDAVVMAAYLPQGERNDEAHRQAFDYAVERLTRVEEQAVCYPELLGIARSTDDLRRLKREGRKAILLGVENGYAIGRDLSRLHAFKRMGVAYMTLCHNGDNELCDSASGSNGEWGGLSPFGREVVAEMNRIGMMIDVSHAADATFDDIVRLSRRPIVATHSSCRALCDHPRNLDDDRIRTLAEAGGVMQICLYGGFINHDDPDGATLSDAIRHILHVVRLVGPDHVGIGSDFDGGGGLIGCQSAGEMIQITLRLLAEGLSDADVAKIWSGNFMRVMDAQR